jgi:ATP-dependent protease ClpP protease subunit
VAQNAGTPLTPTPAPAPPPKTPQPDVYTIAIGQALGSAALILAAGKQGARYVLPHARVLVAPPRLNR